MIRIGALLAVATAVTVKRDEPSLTEKAAHLLQHPIETLTRETPHEPRAMKDVCPECNKDKQPPLGEHVKQIIEEAVKTGHASWEAVKDKTAEMIDSPIEMAKQAVNSYKPAEEPASAWDTLKEGVQSIKDKVAGGTDSSKKALRGTPQTGGTRETLKEGVGTVKDKILGERYASHYPKAMEEQGVWHTMKEGMEHMKEKIVGGEDASTKETLRPRSEDYMQNVKHGINQPSNRASDTLNDLASKTADTIHGATHKESPDSVNSMKDVCPECHKRDKEPTVLETVTQPLKDLKHTANAIKDDVKSGVADIATDTAYGVRRGAEGAASMASDAAHGVKRGAEGVASVASEAVHGIKRGAEGAASAASDAVHGVARGAENVASEAAHGVKRGAEGAASLASDAAHDLRHGAEHVGSRATDAVHQMKHDAEHAAHRASETVKSGAADVKSKIEEAVPDTVSWREQAGALKDKVLDTMAKPFQSLKGDAEDAAHRVADTASQVKDSAEHAKDRLSDTASQIKDEVSDRGIPHHWYPGMMAIKESIEKQFQEVVGNIGKEGYERVSFVQQSVEKVGNSWVSYMNDNGNEHLDVQLDDADAKTFDPLKALNAARHSNGMPARANLDGVKVQIHRREKPHYYLRTTRILPNGSWTQYENDNGVELVTEGHISKKDVIESAPEKARPDKHPLLNMFRRTLGFPELVEKTDA